MKTCKLTINPDKVVELEDNDFTDLLRSGLVVPGSYEQEDAEDEGDMLDDVDTSTNTSVPTTGGAGTGN